MGNETFYWDGLNETQISIVKFHEPKSRVPFTSRFSPNRNLRIFFLVNGKRS